jgi:YjbE family integral membrane protein
MTVELLLKIAQIIAIDIVLSGDNAVVIAMAAHKLPPVQRKTAIMWGGGIAILLRIVFTVLMAFLLMIPVVRLVGGIVLVWIACKLLLDEGEGQEINTANAGRSTWAAIRMIFVADFVMSLDNMLAVAGAAGEKLWMIVMGLLVSIAIIMFFSSVIAMWMNRYHWIVYLGAAILAFTAGEMIMGDRELAGYFARTHHVSLNGNWEEEFMVTREKLMDWNGDDLPDDLKDDVRYHRGKLEFIGQMTEKQRDELLQRVDSESDKEAINAIYERSHFREVPDWVPPDYRLRVENWFQRRWPAEVWKGVQGRQYHFVARIVYGVVVVFCLALPYWLRRRETREETAIPPTKSNLSASGGREPPG